jgi:hypothetical protein
VKLLGFLLEHPIRILNLSQFLLTARGAVTAVCTTSQYGRFSIFELHPLIADFLTFRDTSAEFRCVSVWSENFSGEI